MQLEIRKSGGETCEHCGATELVVSGRTSELLQRDLLPLVAQELTRFEQELVQIAAERQHTILLRAERRVAEVQDAYEQRITEVFEAHAPRLQPLRRKFHSRLKEALDTATRELVSETKY